jgi:hypothetical protein
MNLPEKAVIDFYANPRIILLKNVISLMNCSQFFFSAMTSGLNGFRHWVAFQL